MITTVRTDLTWDGKVGKMINDTSEKKLRQTLKDMTGAVDAEIIEINSWDEENEVISDKKKGKKNVQDR